MARSPKVLIIGAGYSGAVLAVQLLARSTARVVLVEREGAFGRGLAYAAGPQAYLLNVRSNRMSAFPDKPDHFVRWLQDNQPDDADPDGFARRSVYGAYIADVLRQASAAAPGRLSRRAGHVVGLETEPRVRARLADGHEILADAAVLAIGNFPPGSPAAAAGLEGSSRYVPNPWAPNALDAVGRTDDVILMGSGLTAVDVLLDLDSRGWIGRAACVSRRGLASHAHDDRQAPVFAPPPPIEPLSWMLRRFRRSARAIPWSRLMDELRPHGQALWAGLDREQRRRFLRHLKPWWDIHRHRLSPEAASQLARLRQRGRLTIAAGNIVSSGRQGEKVLLRYRPRGGTEQRTVSGAWLVNCTGPELDLSRIDDPLLGSLLAGGTARTDDLRLGLDVTADSRVINARGRPHARLFALGPITRGTFWEIIAVPDIRGQAAVLAETLATDLQATPQEPPCSTRSSSPIRARSAKATAATSLSPGASHSG